VPAVYGRARFREVPTKEGPYGVSLSIGPLEPYELHDDDVIQVERSVEAATPEYEHVHRTIYRAKAPDGSDR